MRAGRAARVAMMAGKPWGKFYWADWLSDPKLKLCSLEAQGLWIRMLCIAAEAKPVGYVVLEDHTLGASELSSECGKPVSVVEAALADLQKWGVYSMDRRGRIFSRRMVRDAKRAKISQKNGKSGGNPSLGKDRGNQDRDNPRLKTQRPETRDQSKKELEANASLSIGIDEPEQPISQKPPESPDEFDACWKAYPHIKGRSAKPKARAMAAAAWRWAQRPASRGSADLAAIGPSPGRRSPPGAHGPPWRTGRWPPPCRLSGPRSAVAIGPGLSAWRICP